MKAKPMSEAEIEKIAANLFIESPVEDLAQKKLKSKELILNKVFSKKWITKTLLVIIFFLLLGLPFYWFQYRPTDIRKSCVEEATKGMNTVTKVRENNRYRECLAKQGLKPESLFVK